MKKFAAEVRANPPEPTAPAEDEVESGGGGEDPYILGRHTAAIIVAKGGGTGPFMDACIAGL